MSDEVKLSPVEVIKTKSQHLRGDIAEEMIDDNSFFGKESIQLLKHHGTYQQDDRDQRGLKDANGKPTKAYSMMVRSKIPGGKLTSQQFIAELDLCDELGDSTMRITTRQGLQLHGILKRDLKTTIQRINEVQLSTLSACGDVCRNFMCCPAPHHNDSVHQQMQQLTDELALHFCPQTNAYHEIWLHDDTTGEKSLVGGKKPDVVEPIYGDTYLPRKFKMAVGLPGDNCIDIHTHDLGLLAICRDYKIIGYNVLVGGGFGMTPSAKKTFPALSQPMAFVSTAEVIEVVTAVVKVQRDFGNRSDRKVARLKYLIHDWGLDKFTNKVQEYYGKSLSPPEPEVVWGHDDHIGWREQGDGNLFYGLNIENGRLLDREGFTLKAALREICSTLSPSIRLTAHQSILFTDLEPASKPVLEEILQRHGITLSEEISLLRRWSMACVAFPTCGLAITESERALPGLIDELEVELDKIGLAHERLIMRMTGCPNGCARPYNADIALVGKAKGKYTLYLGGNVIGTRLNFIYQDMLPAEDIIATLLPVFHHFKQSKQDGETFGDFCARVGKDELLKFAETFVGV